MKQRLKLYTGIIGLISVAISTTSFAEHSLQLGLAASVNTSFYEDVGEERYAFPLIIAEYDRFYLQGIHGGYRFFQNEKDQSLALEIRRTFDGYNSKDSDALAGMDDRDAAWEAGLAYEITMADGQAKAKLMHDISNNHNGFSARFEYERPLLMDAAHLVSWYTGLEYWSRRKTDYYFGVTPEEAMSAHPVYAPNKSYNFNFGVNTFKRLNDKFTVIFNAEYLRASDAVNDSPLTTRQDQWSAYAGVFYRF